MGPFLRGFTDELVKVAAPATWSSVVRPPSTATGAERAPRPANALPPSNAMSSSIPTQRMESPARAQQQTWRPSPGYRPKPSSDPRPPAPTTPKRGGVSRPSNAQPAWEASPQMHQRKNLEAAANQGRKAGGPAPAGMSAGEQRAFTGGQRPPTTTMQPGGLQLKPGQQSTFKPPPGPLPKPPTPTEQAIKRNQQVARPRMGIGGSSGRNF